MALGFTGVNPGPLGSSLDSSDLRRSIERPQRFPVLTLGISFEGPMSTFLGRSALGSLARRQVGFLGEEPHTCLTGAGPVRRQDPVRAREMAGLEEATDVARDLPGTRGGSAALAAG